MDKLIDKYTLIDAAEHRNIIDQNINIHRIFALAKYLNIHENYVYPSILYTLLEAKNLQYQVLSHNEVNSFAQIAAQYKCEKNIISKLPKLPESIKVNIYFEEWINDEIEKGRGLLLATDGKENEITVNDLKFYIYYIQEM